MLLFGFPSLPSPVFDLHGPGRFVLRSFKLPLVLLDCIFSEAFEADPGPVGLPVKEAGPVYFLAPHHLCGCRVVLLCTCISEAPNKNTLWSACEELLASSVSLASDQRADASVLLGRRIDPATEGSAVCLKALLPRQPFPLVLN